MRLGSYQWLSLICICLILLVYGSLNQEVLHAQLAPLPQKVAQVPIAPIPVLRTDSNERGVDGLQPQGAVPAVLQPEVSAVAAIAIDQQSGTVLFDKNGYRIYAPASTTKLMTALVARDVFKTGSILTVPDLSSVGGTKIGLRAGEQLTIESVLEGALIASGNDAAYTIAANHPEGAARFIELMNKKAQDLHLVSTYFENATGFDSETHRTSAFDLALLAREVMKDSLLRSIVRTKQATVLDLSGKLQHSVTNTNQLLLRDETVVGVKTGTTEEAGQVLIAQFEKNGQQVVVVVLGSLDRYADTSLIRDWIWQAYLWKTPEELSGESEAGS